MYLTEGKFGANDLEPQINFKNSFSYCNVTDLKLIGTISHGRKAQRASNFMI